MTLEDGMGLLGRKVLARELDNAGDRYDTHIKREKQRGENGITSEYARWLRTGETVD